jgi:hypothetical protein
MVINRLEISFGRLLVLESWPFEVEEEGEEELGDREREGLCGPQLADGVCPPLPQQEFWMVVRAVPSFRASLIPAR